MDLGQRPLQIAEMPVITRLQGSCYAPLDRHRYGEQIEALKRHADITSDPYDVAGGTALKAMNHCELASSPDEPRIYQYTDTP